MSRSAAARDQLLRRWALLAVMCVAPVAGGCVTLPLPMAASTGADDYFVVSADINGRPVRLVLDTGAQGSALVRGTATALALKTTEWPTDRHVPPGKSRYGITEPCTLTVWTKRTTARFHVLDLPSGLSHRLEGLLGWPDFRHNVMHFEERAVTALARIPPATATWLQVPLRPNARTLSLTMPGAGSGPKAIEIDSGGVHGVSLNTEEWQQWTARHPHRPRTLDAYYMPGTGLRVQEITWAEAISLGPLTITGVPLREANVTEVGMAPMYRATLGLAAMRRLDLIVDGKADVAYVRPKQNPAAVPRHNRLGAVFVPADVDKTDALIAVVLAGSPASEAGIRDGDVLLRVDAVDVTKWRSDPAGLPGRFWTLPAGTSLPLELRRGTEAVQTRVTLRDLIGPGLMRNGGGGRIRTGA